MSQGLQGGVKTQVFPGASPYRKHPGMLSATDFKRHLAGWDTYGEEWPDLKPKVCIPRCQRPKVTEGKQGCLRWGEIVRDTAGSPWGTRKSAMQERARAHGAGHRSERPSLAALLGWAGVTLVGRSCRQPSLTHSRMPAAAGHHSTRCLPLKEANPYFLTELQAIRSGNC